MFGKKVAEIVHHTFQLYFLRVLIYRYKVVLLIPTVSTQPDEQSINFTQMVDGTPVESSIPKDIIVEIYKVVGNYRRQ
jgi:hypothetical protein